MRFGASYSTSNNLLLVLPDTFWLWASKNAFKSWQCKIRKFTVTSFHCEESTHRKLKQLRDLSDAGQKSRELTTPHEPPNSCMTACGRNRRTWRPKRWLDARLPVVSRDKKKEEVPNNSCSDISLLPLRPSPLPSPLPSPAFPKVPFHQHSRGFWWSGHKWVWKVSFRFISSNQDSHTFSCPPDPETTVW